MWYVQTASYEDAQTRAHPGRGRPKSTPWAWRQSKKGLFQLTFARTSVESCPRARHFTQDALPLRAGR